MKKKRSFTKEVGEQQDEKQRRKTRLSHNDFLEIDDKQEIEKE